MSREVWAEAEISPEPYHDHLFSPPADGQGAAPRVMGAPQRGKRSWSQISKQAPPFRHQQHRQHKDRTRPKSPKLSRSIPPRRQREDAPAQVGGSSGSGDESLDALEEGRIRRTHNLMEKQYRNPLNAQFELLLALLPAESESQEERGGRRVCRTRPSARPRCWAWRRGASRRSSSRIGSCCCTRAS